MARAHEVAVVAPDEPQRQREVPPTFRALTRRASSPRGLP